MAFEIPADSYDRFMGRYSGPLADRLLGLTGAAAGDRALDVGCGPGAMTSRLSARLGAEAVAAIDPSESFVATARERCPGVDVRLGVAEALPWDDGVFDLAVAPLVVHFMSDPVAGLREMGRVTRPGGVVAATVWDHGGAGPLATYRRAVLELWPDAPDEARLAGSSDGDLARLFAEAGLLDLEPTSLTVTVRSPSFDEWWEPYTLGVGPAGAFVDSLDDADRERLRRRCAELLPDGGFDVSASAWCVVGHAPS